MSALGDYVHYNKANYYKYGLNHTNTTPSESWTNFYNNYKSQLKTAEEVTSLVAEAKNIEDQYNNLFYPTTETDESIAFKKQFEQSMQDLLEEEFGLMAGKVNSNNISVDATELYTELKSAISTAKENIKINYLNKNSTLQTMQNTLNKVSELLEQDSFKSVAAIQSELSSAKGQVAAISKRISTLIKEKSGGRMSYQLKNQDIDSINKIIKTFYKTPLVESNQSGQLLEWAVPLIKLKIANLANETVADEIKKLATSSNSGKSTIKVDVSELTNDVLQGSEDLGFTVGGVTVQTTSAKSKIDATITYTDTNDEPQTAGVSVKNKAENQSIRLVHDTTLHRVLLLSNSYTFANHYLNVVTKASGGKKSYGADNQAQILEANRAVKALIFKLAAEGYDANNPASLLIVNDQAARHIHVYNLKALIILIQKKMLEDGSYTNLISAFSNSYRIIHTWSAESKENRIANMLQTLNNVKINLYLTTSALQPYLKLLETGSVG